MNLISGFFSVAQKCRVLWQLWLLSAFSPAISEAQQGCREVVPDAGFVVRRVQVKGRWVPEALKATVAEIAGIGAPFQSSRVSRALIIVSDETKKAETFFPPQLAGALAVSYTTVRYCAAVDTPRSVNVIIEPRYLRIDLYRIGRNFLPVPRSARPTFYERVPKPLLALSPVFSFQRDRRAGTSVAVETFTNLLHPTLLLDSKKTTQLGLQLFGKKSIDEPFYAAGGGLSLWHQSSAANRWMVEGRFLKSLMPLATGNYKVENSSVQASFQQGLKTGFLKNLAVGGGFRFLRNEYDSSIGKTMANKDRGYRLFLLGDGLVAKRFARMGVWLDGGFPQYGSAYQRLAAKLGYSTSVSLAADKHQVFGIELLLGAGKAWGDVPVYNRFFAGNAAPNFLYEGFSNTLAVVPEGPLVRSLGEREGTLQRASGSNTGGRSYWHLNLNVSIPVPAWSRPLIPPIVLDEASGATLQTKLKSLARGTAESSIATDLIDNQGFPDNAQTDSLAKSIVARTLMPMISFVTDRANVFSIRPLLLFDVAGLSEKEANRTHYFAAGAGVQLTVVVARLGAGYMRTIAPASNRSKGNFFLQFVVENLF